ncbi:MAG: hypothetical protein NVS9B4_01250 [Candidatus Acidiferrum sp.]
MRRLRDYAHEDDMTQLETNAIEALRKAADEFEQAAALCRDAGLHLDGLPLHGRCVCVRDLNEFIPKLVCFLEELAKYESAAVDELGRL